MSNTIKISFTGDILVFECQNKCSRHLCKYDYTSYLEQAKPVFAHSDYVVGNLETTCAGWWARYTHSDIEFNTPDSILKTLKEIGVDMVTTANNHVLDRKIKGLKRTMRKLKDYGLEYTGTRMQPQESNFLIKEFDGVKVAFIAYTYGVNEKELLPNCQYMVNITRKPDSPSKKKWYKRLLHPIYDCLPKSIRLKIHPLRPMRAFDDCVGAKEIGSATNQPFVDSMLATIQEAKKNADIVIFCLHSGGQFSKKIGEYTQWLINTIQTAGVNAIVTNHAHTILPIEKADNGCVIAYALGNFSFTPGVGYFIEGVEAEKSIVLNLYINKEKKIIEKYDTNSLESEVDANGAARVVIKE